MRLGSGRMVDNNKGIIFVLIMLTAAYPGNAAMDGYDYTVIPATANGFVNHLYKCILERNPIAGELDSWTQDIESGQKSLRGAFREFFESSEYEAKSTNNTFFVTQLFQCMLFRDPNEPALTNYVNALESGNKQRYQMFDNFVFCDEFKKKENRLLAIYPIVLCDSLLAVKDTSNDASQILQGCIDNANPMTILEISPGRYMIKNQIEITKPIIIRTQDKDSTMAKCDVANHDCAEFIAGHDFYIQYGLFEIKPTNNVQIDHIVINGNKEERWHIASVCDQNGTNLAFHNIDDLKITGCVFKNSLCGAGLYAKADFSQFLSNTIAFNGIHGRAGFWADGFTFGEGKRNAFLNNEFIDNTDIDFVLGGCSDCQITGNTIKHSAELHSGSFGALILHAWPHTSGNFSNTDVSLNTIDCGLQCGYGLSLGSDAWFDTIAFGAHVHDNTIQNAQHGFIINDAKDMNIHDNIVEGTVGEMIVRCDGPEVKDMTTFDYSIGTGSSGVTASNPDLSEYQTYDWPYHCYPNWWNDINNAGFVNQNVPSSMQAGSESEVKVIMKNSGTVDWGSGFKLGSQNPQDNQIWSVGRIPVDETVYPGEAKTFCFNITAPSDPSTYDFQWRMIEEGVEWFGDFTASVEIDVDAASQCGPADLPPYDGIVDDNELFIYVGKWKAGSVLLGDLIDAIGKWKNGC